MINYGGLSIGDSAETCWNLHLVFGFPKNSKVDGIAKKSRRFLHLFIYQLVTK